MRKTTRSLWRRRGYEVGGKGEVGLSNRGGTRYKRGVDRMFNTFDRYFVKKDKNHKSMIASLLHSSNT